MDLIDTCLGISGQFEGGNGGPRFDLIAGNSDDCGISVGCLQWNPASGSLHELLTATFEQMPNPPATFQPIKAMLSMSTEKATVYAIQTWIDNKKQVTQAGMALWSLLLRTVECRKAQEELAQIKLDKALTEADKFMPFLTSIDDRTAAFFFDVRVQQGGLTKKINGQWWSPGILSDPSEADWKRAVALARENGKEDTAKAWEATCPQDPLAGALLHYAYERASKARPEYIWDALARRGTIACRRGAVHGKWFDLTQILP